MKHIGVTISFIRRQLKIDELAGKPQQILMDDRHYLTYTEAWPALDELEEQGYECVPTCDHVDAKGHCLGHSERHKS